MQYERSLGIEMRLQALLRLIRSGRYSTPMLAKQLGVSIPTVSRDLIALREHGHEIRSARKNGRWQYILISASAKAPASMQHRTSGTHTLIVQSESKHVRREARIA